MIMKENMKFIGNARMNNSCCCIESSHRSCIMPETCKCFHHKQQSGDTVK